MGRVLRCPRGVLDTYRLRCPGIDGESCRFPRGDEDIPVSLISSETTGVYIESVVLEEFKTILEFSGDVTSELLDGDAITLDEATILLNGRGQNVWTETERYLVSKLSGFYNFADEPDKMRMLWNRISFVDAAAGSGQVYETNKLSIPVGWADGVDAPVFTFVDAKGGKVTVGTESGAFPTCSLQHSLQVVGIDETGCRQIKRSKPRRPRP